MSEQPQETTGVSRETGKQAPSKRNRRSAVYIYLLILFGAAFMMLLLAYFVQQRNSESTISDLRNSMTVSREELMEEIETLEGEKQGLEAQIAELERDLKQEQEYSYEFQVQYDGARNRASHLEYCLDRRSEAMELFYLLDRAYTQGRNQQCQGLIEWMERPDGGPLKDFLPTRDDRSNYSFGVADGATPAERYQEIVETLS